MAAGDDLNDPLGLDRPSPRPRVHVPYRLILAASATALLFGAVLLQRFGDPLGGEPYVIARIVPAPQRKSAPPSSVRAKAAQIDEQPTGTIAVAGDDTAAEVERKSGVKVIRAGQASPPGAMIIDVRQALGQKLAPAPDPRLVEESRFGLLPHIGSDGARPADVYARPDEPAPQPHMARIALIVGGLGLSEAATAEAIARLPGTVTLAFAPYGRNLKNDVAQARNAGHEVILQLPMETVDAQANPGPHTLSTAASPSANAENLHWLLSRFTGYTGIENFLGGKFTASAESLRPVLREIAERGLFYVDDGSSAVCISLNLAQELGLPAIRTDLTIDADGTPKSIDANLATLESIARERGMSVGMASDLPSSLEKIAAFAKMAQARGIQLIPISAAVRTAAQRAHSQAARALRDR